MKTLVLTQELLDHADKRFTDALLMDHRESIKSEFMRTLLQRAPFIETETEPPAGFRGGKGIETRIEALVMSREDFSQVTSLLYSLGTCPQEELPEVVNDLVYFMLNAKPLPDYSWKLKIIEHKD